MRSGISLFKSKVAKRIFLLFLLCAMLPIAIFSGLSFFQVSANLKEQSISRLQSNAKSYGLILIERFSLLESELLLYATPPFFPGAEMPVEMNSAGIEDHFISIGFISNSGDINNLFGKLENLPDNLLKSLTADMSSNTSTYFETGGNTYTRVFLAKKMPDINGSQPFLVGELNTVYLWGVGHENILPTKTELSILDQNRNIIFSSFQLPSDTLHQIHFDSSDLQSRSLEYASEGQAYLLVHWPLFLKSRFDSQNLIIVMRNTQGDIFEPLENFKILFPLVVLLSLWIVLLLSIISIRKSLFPLENLKEGALRLARRDFNSRVTVDSQDEFKDLADTFNMSASALGRQFRAMEAMAEIDHTIHTSLSMRPIVDTALKRMCSFFSCKAIFLGLVNERKPEALQIFTYIPEKKKQIFEEFRTVTSEDMHALLEPFDQLIIDAKTDLPSYLPDSIVESASHFMVLPMYHSGIFFGILCLGHQGLPSYSDDDLSHAKRLSSQVALALSNAQLIDDLKSLNLGTLEALARTVDAKSKWTAGHSERVTELSVKTARILGCDDKTVNTLHRAAFLHDIGKIGIPMSVLDKPAKLTDEEYEKVMEHPVIGAKILEPIEAYRDTIPIILQHHECFDGKGYPSGISGEEITLGARILTVADVYDALVSNRPYRQGWVEEKVIQLLKDEAGKKFDPNVIDAFLSAISLSSNVYPGALINF